MLVRPLKIRGKLGGGKKIRAVFLTRAGPRASNKPSNNKGPRASNKREH